MINVFTLLWNSSSSSSSLNCLLRPKVMNAFTLLWNSSLSSLNLRPKMMNAFTLLWNSWFLIGRELKKELLYSSIVGGDDEQSGSPERAKNDECLHSSLKLVVVFEPPKMMNAFTTNSPDLRKEPKMMNAFTLLWNSLSSLNWSWTTTVLSFRMSVKTWNLQF